MLTFGYSFFPWNRPETLAPAGLILDYLRSVVEKFGLGKYIRYKSPVTKAAWSSDDAQWTVTIKEGNSTRDIRTKFFFMCGGYYEYDRGNTPHFEGREDFKGEVVHPQAWESSSGGKVDVAGKRVAVIGSGATAITLVPELVKEGASHVTCVQRSPSYIMDVSPVDWFVKLLRVCCVSVETAARIGRWRQIWTQCLWYRFCTTFPSCARFLLLWLVKAFLGRGTDMVHWTPKYDPWKQRLCACVDGDFFNALKRGQSSMATGHIERFTPNGLRLTSGQEVEADVIVTATGMNMQRNFPMSWIETSVDGVPYVASEHMAYKGLMLSHVPNFFYCFGYPNISWTLKADLIARFACRAVAHCKTKGLSRCEAVPGLDVTPSSDEKGSLGLSSGYLQRAASRLPTVGSRAPWVQNHDYFQDVETIGEVNFDGEAPEIAFA